MPQGFATDGFLSDNLNLELQRWPLYIGAFAFVTVAQTCTLRVPKEFRRYHVVGIVYCGTPANGETPYVQAPNSDGTNSAEGSEGAYFITITRVIGQTSGLCGTITLRGVP